MLANQKWISHQPTDLAGPKGHTKKEQDEEGIKNEKFKKIPTHFRMSELASLATSYKACYRVALAKKTEHAKTF